MFEFVCDHLIPGCAHKDSDQSEAELLERAGVHFQEHHSTHHFNEPLDEVLKKTGITFIKPV
ncbi:MAG: DUF1059 domain-containing protein [Acidimicrobiia bacterium]